MATAEKLPSSSRIRLRLKERETLFVCVGKQQLWTSKTQICQNFSTSHKRTKGHALECTPETDIPINTQVFITGAPVLYSPEHVWATWTGIMISHYPLASLLPWPPIPHCLDLDGEGGVALQRYQPRSPESSPRYWVSHLLCLRLL